MKKVKSIFAIAIMIVIATMATVAYASEQPTCGEGSHFEGRFEVSESCSRQCVKKKKGKCVKRAMVCNDTSQWVGSCVTDEVAEDEDGGSGETPEEVAPLSNNSWIVMLPKITQGNYYMEQKGNEVIMHFLTNYRTEGFSKIIDLDTGLEALHPEGEEHTFHSVKTILPAGNYKIYGVSKIPFYGTELIGKAITFEIK